MSDSYKDLPLTQFPESVDTFITWLDVLASDGTLIKQYQEAVKVGNFILAKEKLEQIPAYNQKIITAQDLNKLEEAIRAVERFYKTDIVPYTNQKQAEWQAIIDKFSYADTFDVSKTYVKNNFVSYGLGSSKFIYIATSNPPQGTLPTNEQYWRKLTVQGKTGVPGQGIAFEGKWDAGRNYTANVAIEYKGALWISLRPNIGKIPTEGSEDWGLIAKIGQADYPLSQEQPSEQVDGDLWFEVLP